MTAKRATGEPKGGPAEKAVTDRRVDEALEDTFPASDPPYFVGGAEPDTTKLEEPNEKDGKRPVHRKKH